MNLLILLYVFNVIT